LFAAERETNLNLVNDNCGNGKVRILENLDGAILLATLNMTGA
jgi:hypothetical protein